MTLRRALGAGLISAALFAPLTLSSAVHAATEAPTADAVVDHYAELALTVYSDALTSANTLHDAVKALIENPSEETLKSAREAWIAARVPYQQSEAFRFGNSVVDDWEGRVNAWPLDEGLIDYVDADSYGAESYENPFYTANVIANPSLKISGQTIDATTITPELIQQLHEIDGVEANVASGYHAIEFLLWGQDLHGTKPGAGERPYTDYAIDNCTGGNCDRRGQYLESATRLLVQDLQEMVNNWKEGGAARAELEAKSASEGLASITTGMGSLAYGELGGERTKLGLMLHDPEEEHDCFSDNTHWSHYYDAKGIQNVYLGQYTRIDGTEVKGPSLSDLVSASDADLDKKMRAQLDNTQAAGQAMVDSAANGAPFDVMIASGNTEGGQLVQNFVDSLVAQTGITEEIIAELALGDVAIEGSDSLDNPSAVGAE
ncbi:Iron-regulated protein A precursor [Marinobacterium lacunae]|uniref:Iron-regulated protein A n=1 Tax=Marinobacterium lacunae TaxID=1232683 RepID=A0A081FVB2_9GAMM|nr:imelysin family protein [Marinobacterium lacunae]KEA62467.1 Iron-regulated protein A precursor [Marinobacterium lacunae]MBR9882224.1 peptidase [Oceanospirillales bacterium]